MSNARIETLDARRLLSATSSGDADLTSGVDFSDLLTLAQNYNGSQAWTSGDSDFDGGVNFADLIQLAQNYNQSSASTSASLTAKGQLVISMGSFNNLSVRQTKRATAVFMNRISRHGEVVAADVFQQSFTAVKSIRILGSFGDDSITLADGLRATTVQALEGNDTVTGGDGSSTLWGGGGDDQLAGGGGDDWLYGEAGADRLSGGTGNDVLDGGAGKDRLDGGKGKNKLAGGSGTDYITVRPSRDKTDRDMKDKLTELT